MPNFICVTCGVNLPTEDALRDHTASVHRAEQGVYVCPKCGAKFGALVALQRHATQAHGS